MTTTINNNQVTSRKVRVQKNFERLAYLFMRLSGILLLFLAVGHTVLQLVINDVHDLTLQVVADNWENWGKRLSEWLLLVFALSHGLNGLRNILEDYIHNQSAMRVIKMVMLAFFVVTILVVSYAIFTFDPDTARNAGLGG